MGQISIKATAAAPLAVGFAYVDDYRTLTVHALDGADPEGIRREVRRQLIQPILAFTR